MPNGIPDYDVGKGWKAALGGGAVLRGLSRGMGLRAGVEHQRASMDLERDKFGLLKLAESRLARGEAATTKLKGAQAEQAKETAGWMKRRRSGGSGRSMTDKVFQDEWEYYRKLRDDNIWAKTAPEENIFRKQWDEANAFLNDTENVARWERLRGRGMRTPEISDRPSGARVIQDQGFDPSKFVLSNLGR